MTTVATTNPQEVKLTDNRQEVRRVLAELASRGAADGTKAPELNGYLLKDPEKPAIFLILNGQRRLVPDVATVNNLFVTNRTVHEDFHIDLIEKGDDLASGAALVKGDGKDPWYLIPGGKVKMWIKTQEIATQYQFRAVTSAAQILVDSIPDGDPVAPRTKRP